ncbi:hypothetical protein [Paenibacillus sp. FSL E2-0178]|uniref:hypothetical protein n=1 Tax=Paenibacillus sp. FSL E2-0178 TaxID=2921361 RepID=UPI00315862E7
MLMFNLEDAIKLLDTNQAKLSALSDVRPNTIADLIKANTKRIEVDTLENLLDALNGLAKSKGIKKYFRVQDIIQYYNDDYEDNEETYGQIIIKEEFELLRNVLSNAVVFTPVKGLEVTNICKVLLLYREKFTIGIVETIGVPSTDVIKKFLLSCETQLRTYSLVERKAEGPIDTRLLLTSKGIEFVNLLRKYGTS